MAKHQLKIIMGLILSAGLFILATVVPALVINILLLVSYDTI